MVSDQNTVSKAFWMPNKAQQSIKHGLRPCLIRFYIQQQSASFNWLTNYQ